ncbi:dolichyl-diphosphooligosaccharide--protein glycosyltransferase subunit 1-like [Lineus longissimus]|uniref:dolichyl-diphosphooligosaccharide--protein glycosyltransferase subunit 1-like n=1 Tax=Lineus longissimus TaxID=88925 RepID=UPI002B4E513C
MDRLYFIGSLFLVLLASCCVANQDTIDANLINTKVERTVDLSSHLAKTTSSITLKNNGNTAVKSFLFVVDPSLAGNLATLSATDKEEEEKLKVIQTSVANQLGKQFWRIQLYSSLQAGKSVTVDVEAVFTHTQRPYPSQISQAEKQFVQFSGNLYFFSPYKTNSQTTKVNLASSTIENYTKTKPVSLTDSIISYGPYENKDSFVEGEMVVHYENNTPFLTITKMTRVIEVSHWGNIAVEETIDMYHSGAKLKGSFSRYDYQRNQDGASSIKSFKTILPSSARDVYYRDEIGNISTSNLKELVDSVEVEFRPRFPLFGGWKTHYYIGYNVPSYEYLYNNGDNYLLKMRFVDHVYDDMVVDEFTLKVILPEGCKNMEFKTPFPTERGKDELHFTYLDTVGRPVVTATKKNLVEGHIQDIKLNYTFQKYMLLQEPFLVITAFYLLFFAVIIYVRLDFSITKDEVSETRMRVTSSVEQVQSTHDKRSALYQSYADAINKYKANKDTTSFHANRKKIDADHKNLTQQIGALQAKLKADNADVGEKIAEIQKLDLLYRDQVNQAVTFAEKLVAGKLNKSQYLENEASNENKKDDILQKMEAILSVL